MQSAGLLEAFVSLLAAFASPDDSGEEELEPAAAAVDIHKDDRKESIAAILASSQVAQVDLSQALISTSDASAGTINQSPVSRFPSLPGVDVPGTPANVGPAASAMTASQEFCTSPFTSQAPLVNAPPSGQAVTTENRADVWAPIAFTLRLEPKSEEMGPAITKQVAVPGLASVQSHFLAAERTAPMVEPTMPTSLPLTIQVPKPRLVPGEPDNGRLMMTTQERGNPPEEPIKSPEFEKQVPTIQERVSKVAKSQIHLPAPLSNDEFVANRSEHIGPVAAPDSTAGILLTAPGITQNNRARVEAGASFSLDRAPSMDSTPRADAVPSSQPIREISMRVPSEASSTVDIKLVDRAGSVHVAVRTSDAELTQNLQSGLSDLVHRLERKGFEAEAWSPTGNDGPSAATNTSSHNESTNSQHGSRDGRESAQQDNSNQQNDGRNRPKWVAELEERLVRKETEPDLE